MSAPPSIYSGMVSLRSRRLRTAGIVLLLAVAAMALYGYFRLMPAVARTLHRSSTSSMSIRESVGDSPGNTEKHPLTHSERARKLMVAVALAYWGVCALLLLAAVVVAWLDLREVTRNYVAERRAIWSETADRIGRQDDAG